MHSYEFKNFTKAIEQAKYQILYRSKVVHSARWQGADIADKPEMATHEAAHINFAVDLNELRLYEDPLVFLREDIQPNLPWADNHFEERVSGTPMNPGTEWKNWPYGSSAARFLDDRNKFNHNYMERYWPRYAGDTYLSVPTESADQWSELAQRTTAFGSPHRGIMYAYGDLDDVVRLLCEDPYTRQAYLPVWFPEDTGGGAKRAPCTIGYHFLMRDGKIDVNYHIRSCDFIRHFRDDLYLTARLLLWVIERAAERDERWRNVTPGKFMMQIGSLHVFRNDFIAMNGG